MFRPPSRSSDVFFYFGYNKIPEVCVASGKILSRKTLTLTLEGVEQRVPGFPIEELIGFG